MPRTPDGMSYRDREILKRLMATNTVDDIVLALADELDDYYVESGFLTPYGDFAKELREAQVKIEHHPFWKTLVP
ncbi:hypothetical protein UFOVP435_49 [uncultured Caudovirales phage]|uniref:Uncharacterized protein n=1 Tax=uncultured Caudovirales phage TaxID=2100421 RepID=A0A6J5MCJ9_9CAUD|nr:hypothetical protein UFOVP435_49 [uncultured Caudovirales phage]